MSSSAFCIDAAASTVMCVPCGNGGDVTTIAYSEPPASAASMSETSSAGSSRSNCIRVPAGTTHNYIQFARVSQEQLSADGPPWVQSAKNSRKALTSEFPQQQTWCGREKALRLPSAAKSFSAF